MDTKYVGVITLLLTITSVYGRSVKCPAFLPIRGVLAHPIATKYFLCLESGFLSEVDCPQGKQFDAHRSVCMPISNAVNNHVVIEKENKYVVPESLNNANNEETTDCPCPTTTACPCPTTTACPCPPITPCPPGPETTTTTPGPGTTTTTPGPEITTTTTCPPLCKEGERETTGPPIVTTPPPTDDCTEGIPDTSGPPHVTTPPPTC